MGSQMIHSDLETFAPEIELIPHSRVGKMKKKSYFAERKQR